MSLVAGQDQLLDMYHHVRQHLPAANGFVAAFNPILSLCTGAHNNASLLGSLGQAKSALFYLIPYQGKTTFPLMGSLSILDHVLKHIQKHQNVAADSGTMARFVKHLLTRVINRIHLQIEISDYQIAASLLELPSMIMSDRYTYRDAWTLPALRSYLSLFANHNPISWALLRHFLEATNPLHPPILWHIEPWFRICKDCWRMTLMKMMKMM